MIARYPFTWAGHAIEVTTHFFAVRLLDESAQARPVNDAAYLEGSVWLPLREVPQKLAFDRNILAAVEQLL